MKIKYLSILMAFLALCLIGAEQGSGSQRDPAPAVSSPKCDLKIAVYGKKKGETTISPDAPIIITFKNTSKEPMMLLDFFEFNGEPFSFDVLIYNFQGEKILHHQDTVAVEMVGPLKYVELYPHETYDVSFPLPRLIKTKYPTGLPKGVYKLVVEYQNQMGNKNCFKGKLVSHPVKFTVKE